MMINILSFSTVVLPAHFLVAVLASRKLYSCISCCSSPVKAQVILLQAILAETHDEEEEILPRKDYEVRETGRTGAEMTGCLHNASFKTQPINLTW